MTATHGFPNLGTQQSPIAIHSTLEAKDLGVDIGWDALILEAKDDAYQPTRKLAARAPHKRGLLKLDGQFYVPVDCHWHFPAEHLLGRRCYASEVHIVHIHKDDIPYAQQGKLDWCRIAVLGVFLEAGGSGAGYAPMVVAADKDKAEHKVPRSKILPRNRSAIRYDGSLTTPPYSENVTFILFETPMPATAEQLKDQGLPNARATQAQNRRYCLAGKVAY